MSVGERIALVTGANRGIGFEIVRGLCKVFNGKVYLTGIDEELSKKAVEKLNKDGYYPQFFLLDITNSEHCDKLANYIKEKYGGLDVLVNNAGIAYKHDATEPFTVQAENTVHTNFFGTLQICNALFPLLRPHARVVHIASIMGHLSVIRGEELRKRFSSDSLTVESLTVLVKEFATAVKNGNHSKLGWPNNSYSVSKVAISALTFIQQREFNNDKREDIIVNCVHPGYCQTDMTGHTGPMTPEQGAVAPVKLATLPNFAKSHVGQYVWHNFEVVDWINGPLP